MNAGPAPGRVTILMCTYNGAAWLEEQLASFLAQTHGDWVLWVSDDGSNDATRAILRAFSARHPGRLERLIDGPRRGAAQNFLHLLCHEALTPRMVALADQDDVWRPDKLARAVAALSCPAGGSGRAYAANYAVSCGARSRRGAERPLGPSFENALLQNVMPGHSIVLDAAAHRLVRQAGPQDVPYHDWYLYQLISGAGLEIVLDDATVTDYRQHASNVMGARVILPGVLKRLRLLRTGHFAAWMTANTEALGRVAHLLTPDARRTLRLWRTALPMRGWHKIALMRRTGLRRQRPVETFVIEAAMRMGHL